MEKVIRCKRCGIEFDLGLKKILLCNRCCYIRENILSLSKHEMISLLGTTDFCSTMCRFENGSPDFETEKEEILAEKKKLKLIL